MSNGSDTVLGFKTLTLEGRKYVDPLDSGGRYAVRYYEPAETDDLAASLRMIKEFDRRFLHFVDRGYSLSKPSLAKMDEVVGREKAIFENPNTSEKERELAGRWYKTALINRSILMAKRHITLRKEAGDAPLTEAQQAELQKLHVRFEEDFTKLMELDHIQLRAKRGYLDNDELVKEMIGEPRKIFISSLPDAMPNALDEFYQGRYNKVAETKKVIDETARTVKQMLPEDGYRALRGEMNDMAEAAMRKVELQHGRADYAEADRAYMAARDHMHQVLASKETELIKKLSAAQRISGGSNGSVSSIRKLEYVTEATDLIYDMAVTRNPAPKALEWLNQRIALAKLGKSAAMALGPV